MENPFTPEVYDNLSVSVESCGVTIDAPEIVGNDIWPVAMKPAGSHACRRTKNSITLQDANSDILKARELYSQGRYNDAFDLYEQLADAYPSCAVAILAEAYDQYETLPNKDDRFHLYQARYFEFGIKATDKVLDIGSGNLPFPFATHLADLALEDGNVGRAGVPFKYLDGKPVYECNIEATPFADNEFDFVYCSHVLEHVDNPEQACREMMRIARRGFIETPTRGKDLWLNTAEISNHRWAVEQVDNRLVFTEYTSAELHGFGCDLLLNMHCAPKTQREKAFSALIYLKADMVNTMLYWDDYFDFEIRRRSPRAPAPSAAPAIADESSSFPDIRSEDLSCVILNTYYDVFLRNFYSKHPELLTSSYRLQMEALQGECFGDSDFYSEGLKKAGWDTVDLIINCHPLQQAWAAENGFSGVGSQIAVEQIRLARPHAVYFQDLSIATKEFIAAIRPFTELIVGQIASPVPAEADLYGFDIVISSFPHFVERFRLKGITSYYQPLAFDPQVLEKFGGGEKTYPVTFVGGISAAHGKGLQLLEQIAGLTEVDFWGYGSELLPQGSHIRERHHGETWGGGMFSLLGQSRITINRHIDVAENNANNMRLFEATGCGALLITDYKENLGELFEIGKEIVAYRSPEECAALIKYYRAHPDEAEAIARAGQARTLRDHTYQRRMEQTAEILGRHLRYRSEAETMAPPDMNRVSSDYVPISHKAVTEEMTTAWQNADIPAHQRSLVQTQLCEMYQGTVALPFQVLASLLKPVVTSGARILEIGCASGYYYEVLEYLLSARLDFTGVDYSEAMIAMARDYYPRARFEVADGAHLPFPDRSFPIVISGSILLHTPDYALHIQETARVAGKYIAAHRTPVCRTSPTSFFTKQAYEVETVELRFNEKELIELFERQGFRPSGQIQYAEDMLRDQYEVSYLFTRVERCICPESRITH